MHFLHLANPQGLAFCIPGIAILLVRSPVSTPSIPMSKIIREKYENGVLVERQTEGSNTTPWHWLMLVVHTVIAISLAR